MPASKVLHRKKPRRGHTNPLQHAFHSFLTQYISDLDATQRTSIDLNTLASSIPKRYTLYPPLLLLPANAFSATSAWTAFTSQLSAENLQLLYRSIVEGFKPQGITHLATNSPISPVDPQGTPNITRSPTGLLPLYGDFGPRHLARGANNSSVQPSEADFSSALWVRTTQNGGIWQTWPPLWTMFSRGNISEKARILGEGTFEGLDGVGGVLGQELGEIAVVDMYVGIGYFAFSYLKRGVGRVYGWEVNGWSVEGLRRGCRVNGWGLRALIVDNEGLVHDEEDRVGNDAMNGLVDELRNGKEIRMVVFQGNNCWARRILEGIKALSKSSIEPGGSGSWLHIRHISLGLLPNSSMSWEDAIDMIDEKRGGWVHVHENVDVRKMEQKRDSIVQHFRAHLGGRMTPFCSHIEQVKTYAPGVMHCVFDMHIEPKPISEAAVDNND